MYDLIIKNGKLVDGTGNPWYSADVAIKDNIIARIDKLNDCSAKKIIDAENLIVSPGFIDAHSHSDIRILTNPMAEEKLYQGVTTEVIGQCGIGLAPIGDKYKNYWSNSLKGIMGQYDQTFSWNSFDEYLKEIELIEKTLNAGVLISYGAVRLKVVGNENRAATKNEIIEMKNIVKNAMKSGALGISLGMIYVPNVFASIEEIIEVCKVVGEFNKVVTIHMTNEGDELLKSIKEVIEISKNSNVNVQISHLKSGGKNNKGNIMEALKLIESARNMGLDITFDQYPYDAASTMLKQVLPPWVQSGGDGKMIERIKDLNTRKKIDYQIQNGLTEKEKEENGGWDNYVKLATWKGIVITSVMTKKNKVVEGKSIEEISIMKGTSPIDTLCDLLIEENGVVSMAIFMMYEDDIKMIMKHPLQSIGSDGLYGGKPHPRLYGTFPRILQKYVRKEKVLSLQEAIRKMTSAPAQRYGLKDRGLLKEGMIADITIFNKDEIEEKSTYEEPSQLPVGVEFVIINGELTLEKGKHNKVFSGKLLRI